MNQPATYARRPNTGSPKFEADPIGSTYRWELYLTPGHPLNKVGLMDGYSKGMGFENPNKVVLLHRKLMNPLLPYLTRCDAILVFENNKALPKEYHKKLIELRSNDFKTFDWVQKDTFLNQFLNAYYTEFIQTGTMPPVEDRRKNVRKAEYMAELDHSKYTFKTLEELTQFCQSRYEKYSATCMNDWFAKHADFQPELFNADIENALIHQVHSSPTQEGAQLAIDQLNKMYGRHPSSRK
ncbi:hypothetical protein DYU11_21165 [Fibrisoma montanum]|uniref:Uncharacterized protein n=2 Tax=Fibrisoma montanum TaxID=2305895 RepID=A0A418M478_9BACT|nr:hypothetical protein DYU11_21165 [Fibrisoma montanum]